MSRRGIYSVIIPYICTLLNSFYATGSAPSMSSRNDMADSLLKRTFLAPAPTRVHLHVRHDGYPILISIGSVMTNTSCRNRDRDFYHLRGMAYGAYQHKVTEGITTPADQRVKQEAMGEAWYAKAQHRPLVMVLPN